MDIVYNKKFYLSSSICYTKGRVLNSQFLMGHIPPLFGKCNFSYVIKKSEYSLTCIFNDAKKIEDFGEGNVDNLNEATLMGYPSWVIFNSQFSYNLNQFIKFNIGLYNILDIHYKTFSSGISAPGRSLMASFKLSF